MAAVIIFIFSLFILICATDFLCLLNHWPSLGYRVQKWSRKNQVFVVALLLIYGTLMTHFLANPVQPATSTCQCAR
jgi:hypothetical protein